jgi:hypothetical protein
MLPSRNFLTLSYIPRATIMRTNFSGSSETSKRHTRKFCSTSTYLLYEDTQLIGIRGRDNFLINL